MKQFKFKTKESKERHRLASSKGGATLRKKCKDKYEQNPHICPVCKKHLPYEKRMYQFCSHHCAITYNNKIRNRTNIPVKKYCINCDCEIFVRNKSKYCSHKCQQEFKFKEFIRKWKNGEIDGAKEYGTSKYIRKYLFEKYNNKCAKCEWGEMNPYSKKIPLEVEHIDGNYMNSKEENLTLLCPNCHSLTSTAKGANRGNGRYLRRLRYKKEKEILKMPL
jgi:predicted nucleic acid-binding Zn ribbon protein